MPELVVPPKVTLVGEANPYGGDPYYALYPAPDGCSGHRLCCLVLKMERVVYVREFDRVNLCPHEWDTKEAKQHAEELKQRGGKYVLLGAKVARAFGLEYTPFMPAAIGLSSGSTLVQSAYLVLPHPSGLCRLWNVPGNYQRARDAVAAFAPHLAEFIGGRKE